jgi:hypothetical protein
MLNKVTNSQFDSAVLELSSFIVDTKAKLLFDGWNYRLTDKAPETFKDLLSFYNDEPCTIPIASYGSDTTIYSFGINSDFRFWHDVLHISYGYNFSYAGETKVNELHMIAAQKAKLSPLALNILHADTQGQTEYYNKYKKFVVNQTAFVWSVVHHGIMNALACEH